ncbi:Hypothetical protein ADU73_0964 [Pediococcus damnosus]|uniref:DUF3923 family protein n=1 Tax=Pediococcus damnosus TaxID=51663 RepID=UPI00078D0129|nr:DUF3923 family protein [Pediococcus damnosus]AMV69370.1 Hypothetical protein ADU73_0964 [Pediococcus damnosus]
MKFKGWWMVNIGLVVLFFGTFIFILFRKVDGAGVVQTPQAKETALVVLGIFFLLVIVCQLVVYLVIHNRKE